GVLRAAQAGGWLQIEDVKQTGHFVEPGFSGTPVWDEALEGMVGIVVSSDTRTELRAAFVIPTTTLIQVWPTLAERATPPSPYRGLSAFREEDAPLYYGRDGVTQRLVAAVAGRPLCAVIGASGSGKSSLVFAGLLPRLKAEGPTVCATLRPGPAPLRALAGALIPLLEPAMTETDRL